MNGFGIYGMNSYGMGNFGSSFPSTGIMGGYSQNGMGQSMTGHTSSITPYASHEKNDLPEKIMILGGIALAAMMLFMTKGKNTKISNESIKVIDAPEAVKKNLLSRLKKCLCGSADKLKPMEQTSIPTSKLGPTLKDQFYPAGI